MGNDSLARRAPDGGALDRRLILLGSYIEHTMQTDPASKDRLRKSLDGFLERNQDPNVTSRHQPERHEHQAEITRATRTTSSLISSPLPRRARRLPVDERLELLVVVRQRLGEREEPPDGVLRAAEAHLDPAGLDRHALGQAGKARLERLDGHRDPDPGEPGLADRGDDPVAARLLAAEGGQCPMPSELAQELGARQGQQVPGPAGAEVRHQGGGADLRDAEEPFEIAADEEVAVERFELADGVGDGEQPAGLGRHDATLRTLDGH